MRSQDLGILSIWIILENKGKLMIILELPMIVKTNLKSCLKLWQKLKK